MTEKAKSKPERKLDALPDTVDFRDTLFVPTLIEVHAERSIEEYQKHKIPILDQGRDGACTGFALATVANYLLRARGRSPNADEVSAWMLYNMAKRYDEWPGEDYEGSSARGAMKGWFKHGLCALALWKDNVPDPSLEEKRSADALARPLGAYFRVNQKDLVAMHSAINETGILLATSRVHSGWNAVEPGQKSIGFSSDYVGSHAFAIVGYSRDGFWIQNSWGKNWGIGGIINLPYADWLANGIDVWVAALGAPVHLVSHDATARMRADAPRSYESQIYADLRPYIITSKNDGVLDDKGTYGLTKAGLTGLLQDRMINFISDWKKKRVLLYAHGGLVGQDGAVQTVATNLSPLLKSEIYPLSFIWRTDTLSTVQNILGDAISKRRDEGWLEATKDFMLDRLDDTIEVVARNLGGKALWDEMKENAERASSKPNGAAHLVTNELIDLRNQGKIDEIHLVGHSAGSIFLAPIVRKLQAAGIVIDTVSLWAPACTIELFEATYKPAIESGTISKFDLYTLDDATEQDDDCAGIYHKSLLYLVKHAFEKSARIPGIKNRQGVPLLGLAKDVEQEKAFFNNKNIRWKIAPSSFSHARHHGEFDNDSETLISTLKLILGSVGTSQKNSLKDRASKVSNTQKLLRRREFLRNVDRVSLKRAP